MKMDSNMLWMGLGLVMVAVSFIIFPIVIDGADAIRTAGNVSEYTGLSSLVSIGPTLVFVGLLFGGVVTTFFGARGTVKRRKAKKGR